MGRRDSDPALRTPAAPFPNSRSGSDVVAVTLRLYFEQWLREYLEAEPAAKRLLVGDVEDAIGSHAFETDEAGLELARRFRRFLQARAHNSSRGRALAAKTVEIREAVLALQDEYEQMTVRQAFYALTVRGIVPKTEAQGYVPVQKQVLALRRQEFLPWAFIADGTRWVRQPASWDDAEDFLREQSRLFRVNRWRSQRVRLEVWLEKDALASTISPTTYAYGVPLMVSRGQSSDTYCYEAAQEAKHAWQNADVRTCVYTLYDSDRSGKSAAAQIEEKLRRYSDGAPITVEMLAVTDEQIVEWDLPTRPPKKQGDPPAVELDAIPPDRLIALVRDAIVAHIDADAWEKERAIETNERELLKRIMGGAA
jgi:hypothetical protein